MQRYENISFAMAEKSSSLSNSITESEIEWTNAVMFLNYYINKEKILNFKPNIIRNTNQKSHISVLWKCTFNIPNIAFNNRTTI